MDPSRVMEIHNFRHARNEFDLGKRVSEEDMVAILEVGRLSAMVTFGYRSEEPQNQKTRRPFNKVVEWIK